MKGEGPLQLIARLGSTIPVIAVDHEDQTLRVLEVVPAQHVLSTHCQLLEVSNHRKLGGRVGNFTAQDLHHTASGHRIDSVTLCRSAFQHACQTQLVLASAQPGRTRPNPLRG